MSEQQTNPDPQRGDMITHIVKRGIPIVVMLLVLTAAFLFWRHVDSGPRHEMATAPQQTMPVHVVTVQNETVPLHPRYLGRTEGSQVVEIRARVAGYLLDRVFEEGTKVTKGQPLFQIDPRPFETDLARAKAHLQSAQATLSRAHLQVVRYQELTARQSATEGELEEWQQQEGVAAADVELAKAEIAAAELNIEYAHIEAPIDGVIGEALKEVGSYVDSGSNGLMAVLQQVDPIDVRFSVTEQEMLRWRRLIDSGVIKAPEANDTMVELTLADGSTYPYQGRVDYVDVKVDDTTGTSIIRAKVPNPDNTLRPGQFVHVNVLGVERLNVIRVPQNAVMQNPTGASVYVVGAEDKIESRPVTLGEWSGGSEWIIESGLKPGDRVVVSRLLMLRPGVPVKIEPDAPESAAASDPHEAGEGSES